MKMTKSQIIAEIEQCKKRIEELGKIVKDMKDGELKIWEPRNRDPYIYISDSGVVKAGVNDDYDIDRNLINFHNVFSESSKDSCQYYARNILIIQNMLWQLHELLCPDYFPDWNDNKNKYCLVYLPKTKKWNWGYSIDGDSNNVYFPYEAVIKACEILNRDGVTK